MSEAVVPVSNIPGIGADMTGDDGHTRARTATAAELHRLRRYALRAGARGLQGVVMIAAGAFLLSEIPSTPGLMLQMALLGVLLIGGGIAFIRAGLDDPALRSRASGPGPARREAMARNR